jgi:hypothetical protein
MRTIALVGLFLLLAAPLAGQQIQSPYDYQEENHAIGLLAGYSWNQTGRYDLGPGPAPIIGAWYSIRFAGPAIGEASFSFLPADRTVYALVDADAGADGLEAQGTTSAPIALAEAALRFQVTGPRTWHGLAPFLIGSAGLAGDLSGSSDLEEEIESTDLYRFGPAFAIGVGAGTIWQVTPTLGVRAEVRNRIWRVNTPTGFRERAALDDHQWTNNVGASVGLSVHF